MKILHGEHQGRPATLVVSTLPRSQQGIPPQAWIARQPVPPYRFSAERREAEHCPIGEVDWEQVRTDNHPESLGAMYENAFLTMAGQTEPLLGAVDAVEIHSIILNCHKAALQRAEGPEMAA